MAKLAPTLADVKAELRIDFDADDGIIQGYIDANAQSILAQMDWANADSIEYPMVACRFDGAVELPVRGADVLSLTYTDTDGDEQTVAVGDGKYETDHNIGRHRLITYLVPTTNWSDVFVDGDRTSDIKVVASADDAPPVILLAIRKMAVDHYRHNGIGTEPAINAVKNLLNPFRLY